MTAVPRPLPGRRFPRHCVVVHDLQLGPHLCARSCYACPGLTAALCTRCHAANLRGEHAGGESTPARANTLRKCAAAAAAPTCLDQLPESRRRGRSPEFRAVAVYRLWQPRITLAQLEIPAAVFAQARAA